MYKFWFTITYCKYWYDIVFGVILCEDDLNRSITMHSFSQRYFHRVLNIDRQIKYVFEDNYGIILANVEANNRIAFFSPIKADCIWNIKTYCIMHANIGTHIADVQWNHFVEGNVTSTHNIRSWRNQKIYFRILIELFVLLFTALNLSSACLAVGCHSAI